MFKAKGRDRDRTNPEWTEKDFARARPASEVIGSGAAEALVRKGGRPPKPVEERKQPVTMRMAPDLLEAMRSTGPGWQTRAEEILRAHFLPAEPGPVDGMILRSWEDGDALMVEVRVDDRGDPDRKEGEARDILQHTARTGTLFETMSSIARVAGNAREDRTSIVSGTGTFTRRSSTTGKLVEDDDAKRPSKARPSKKSA